MPLRRSRLLFVGLAAVLVLAWMGSRRLSANPTGDAFRVTLGGSPLTVPDSAWTLLDSVFSVHDAVATGGGWALLDGTGTRLHVLGPTGTVEASWGRKGDGPGELRYPAALAVLGDTLWVADLTTRHLDGFTLNGEFLRRLTPEAHCFPSLLDDLAARDGHLYAVVRCISLTGQRREVMRIDPRSGAATALPWPGPPPPRVAGNGARLVDTPDGLLVGSQHSPCLHQLMDAAAAALCMEPDARTPLPPSIQETLREGGGAVLRAALSGPVSPFHPYYLELQASGRGLAAVTVEGEDQVVVRFWELSPPVALRVPDQARPFVGPEDILLVSQALDGVRVALAPLPGRTPPTKEQR